MDQSDDMKQYEDPLMDRIRSKSRTDRQSRSRPSDQRKNYWVVIAGSLFAVGLVALAYFLYQSQQQLTALNNQLQSSQDQLVTVSEQLETSGEKIGELETGLSKSEVQLGSQRRELGRYQKLYSSLQSSQAKQGKELEAMAIGKADQAEVGALKEELQQKTEGLEQQVGAVNTRLDETNSNLSGLEEATESNRSEIAGNRDSLGSLTTKVDANAEEIGGVKRSLDRDYYNFELQRNGGVMKVFSVSMQLKNTDFKNQRYHVEIVADGRRLNKKRVNINEPIFFYVEGQKKPYEILVNRVDKKFVVGYLSVPKT